MPPDLIQGEDANRTRRSPRLRRQMITPEQVKEARALLGWSTKQLADEAALGVRTLEAFENGRERLVMMHKVVIREVLERAGVHIVDGKPVGLKARKSPMRRVHVDAG
jgi:ribosome-binding protein aMBF1 (putative translation factor)